MWLWVFQCGFNSCFAYGFLCILIILRQKRCIGICERETADAEVLHSTKGDCCCQSTGVHELCFSYFFTHIFGVRLVSKRCTYLWLFALISNFLNWEIENCIFENFQNEKLYHILAVGPDINDVPTGQCHSICLNLCSNLSSTWTRYCHY